MQGWRILHFVLLAALSSLSALSYGASADTQTEAAGDTESQDSAAKSKQPSTAGTKDKSTTKPPSAGANGEIFIPTEEISEDYNVSFPADI